MSGNQIVRTSASADVDLRRGGAYQITVAIERTQKARLIGVGVRLNSFQGVFAYEERRFHSAIVPPKSYGAPGLVIRATVIRKINHGIETDQIVAGSRLWPEPESAGGYC